MNYADRIMETGKPSDKDSEFESVIDAIWRVESKLEVGSQPRMALYEARRAASTAKCLYRQASETPECLCAMDWLNRECKAGKECLHEISARHVWGEKPPHEHLWEGDGPCRTCKCGAEILA